VSEAAAPRASAMRTAFAEMPLVLKGVTSFFGAFGAVSLLLCLAPGMEHRVAGARLTTGELWESGLGPAALVLGLWLLACALGLLRRAALAGWGVVLAYPVLAGVELGAGSPADPARQALLATAWALAAWAYLFRTRGARAFLRASPRRAP